MVSWVVTLYSLEKSWHFGRTYHLFLQGESVNQEINHQKQANSVCLLLLPVSFLHYSSTLKMERICSSEMPGCLWTRLCSSEDDTPHNHYHENLILTQYVFTFFYNFLTLCIWLYYTFLSISIFVQKYHLLVKMGISHTGIIKSSLVLYKNQTWGKYLQMKLQFEK